MKNEKDNCETGIHDVGQYYYPSDPAIDVDGAYNFVVENKSGNLIYIDHTIDLQPIGTQFSARDFYGNGGRKKYKGTMALTWPAGAAATDHILVIANYEKK